MPTASEPTGADSNTDTGPARKGKGKHDKHIKKKKKNGDRSAKKGERGRGGKNGGGKKNGKSKSSKHLEKEYQKPTKKPSPPKGTLAAFLDYFESKRRLLVR